MAVAAAARRAERTEPAPTALPVLLLAVAAATFAIDPVLVGLVRAGQGIEAICLYLGLSRTALDASLARLGLRTPHDKPLRRGGAYAWAAIDVMRLIAWRVSGVHPADIGERLGRSPNAVRAKCRRLGIPTPVRRALRRVAAGQLIDPTPGFGLPANAESDPWSASGSVAPHPSPADLRGRGPVVALHPGAVLPQQPSGRFRQANHQQRELRLFRSIPSSPSIQAGLAGKNRSRSAADLPASAEAAPSARVLTDLSWIATARNRTRNRAVVEALSLAYFGRQSYRAVAQAVGVTVKTISSFYNRIDLPRDHDRKKFGDTCDRELAERNLAQSGYELAVCGQSGHLFWRHKSDRGRVRFNRKTRILMGKIDQFERYRSATIEL